MEQGHAVTVLSTGTSQQLQVAEKMGLRVIDVRSSSQNPFHILRYMLSIRRSMLALNADVCLTFTIRPAIWGNLVTRWLGIPTLTNITGIGPLFASKSVAYRIARSLYRFSLSRTAHIFFQNTDDRNLFLKHGFLNHQSHGLIPGSGIDYVHFSPSEKTINKDAFVFLYIGRLLKDKGIVEFVEAARKVRKQHQHVMFRVIGPLWTQNLKGNTITAEQLEGWVEEGIINYVGEVLDVRNYIASSDTVVLPSYREGTSNVLLEASSMERPCITCDTTGCREIVEDGVTGYLCKVADAEDLADKMLRIINLPDVSRIDMGKKAREKVMREYDKKLVIDAYLKSITEVVVKSNPK
jgi:glycosyltransferase involved in cell wall biosynthesis